MHSPHEQPRRNHTVVLPSGRRVVVNYVDATKAPDPEQHIEICGGCGSHLVHPLDWEPFGAAHWQITLRCPECEWVGTGVFDEPAVHRFDDALEEGSEQVRADLLALERANMEDFAERFTAALHADQILPADF